LENPSKKELDIKILNKLDKSYYSDAVCIFYEAFEQKIRAFIKSKEKALSIYEKSLIPDKIFPAVLDNKIVGFAGLQHNGRSFIEVKYATLRLYYNPFKSAFIYQIFKLMTPKIKKDTVRIDSIAVLKPYRSMGIGTMLINEVFDFARKNGLKKVRLEVVDTNPKAKALYERMGFVQEKKVNYYFFARTAGFSSEYIMVYTL